MKTVSSSFSYQKYTAPTDKLVDSMLIPAPQKTPAPPLKKPRATSQQMSPSQNAARVWKEYSDGYEL